jgi:hypothetical protein
MLSDPRQVERDFQEDLKKVRVTRRVRLGMVAGVAAVALFQTDYQRLETVALVLGVLGASLLLVLWLATRDTARAQARYDSRRFKVPVPKSKK